MTSTRILWLLWLLLSVVGAAYLTYAVRTDASTAKRSLLPGDTTHGHYQIELACNACHTEFMGVKQDACVTCHGEELKAEKDTHPASKFNDPTNADRLAKLDAQKCITCHREHVPDRTGSMGLSLPKDYCFHCHDDVAEQRPSHVGMTHDSCATAGCHNYHDNKALYENFLYENVDQPAVSDNPAVALRNLIDRWTAKHAGAVTSGSKSDADPDAESDDADPAHLALTVKETDAPSDLLLRPIVEDWAETAHAMAGVNCRACHEVSSDDGKMVQWTNKVNRTACAKCHEQESESFVRGRHGMRLAMENGIKLSAMRPELARLPMHEESAHKKLDCSACHQAHRYDTKFAAVEACISCHDDEHTNNYKNSIHYELWKEEIDGDAEPGTGVSCATCHMPRIDNGGKIHVQHNQNYNLRPNEKMIRSVCMSCHGLEFSLNSLADSLLIEKCFRGQPSVEVDSAQMAKRWFQEKLRQRAERQKSE